jgi:hypothetical protein
MSIYSASDPGSMPLRVRKSLYKRTRFSRVSSLCGFAVFPMICNSRNVWLAHWGDTRGGGCSVVFFRSPEKAMGKCQKPQPLLVSSLRFQHPTVESCRTQRRINTDRPVWVVSSLRHSERPVWGSKSGVRLSLPRPSSCSDFPQKL